MDGEGCKQRNTNASAKAVMYHFRLRASLRQQFWPHSTTKAPTTIHLPTALLDAEWDTSWRRPFCRETSHDALRVTTENLPIASNIYEGLPCAHEAVASGGIPARQSSCSPGPSSLMSVHQPLVLASRTNQNPSRTFAEPDAGRLELSVNGRYRVVDQRK